ncbi:MAG: DUF2231 domain-containing protein [Amaricoccus sp.]
MIPVELIHPMIIHFPIVFIICLAAFDVIATARGHSVTGRNTAGDISTALMVLAALSAVAAMMFGDLALSYAESKGFSSNVAEIHEGLGGAVASTFAIWAAVRTFLWWRDTRVSGATAYAVAFVAVVGAGLAITTAYFGGKLVYDLGVNVASAAPVAEPASE